MSVINGSATYPESPRAEMIRFVPSNARKIIDIGCHTGSFGLRLKQESPREVWGIELNPVSAAAASTRLDHVLVGKFDVSSAIPNNYFDAVIFNDVLEHMEDPWEALRVARTKLSESGIIVASIPNLRHIDNIIHILRDKDFRYEAVGVRDRTHLRFFTETSIRRMFLECELSVIELKGINERWWTESVSRRIAFRLFPNALQDMKYLQFAVVARPNRS